MARAPLRAGDPARIGHYQLTARLGSGGMGVVYLGARWDGSQVAVKVLRPELADDPDFRRRFRRVVAALMRVKGVCTVRVIEADTESPQPFMVTEYIWWSPDLVSWTRAHDANETSGSSRVLAVAAGPAGFVSAGARDHLPAVWTSPDGRTWTAVVLPLPAGAPAGVIQQVAVNGNHAVALGQLTTAHAILPFAEQSGDRGQTWHPVPFSAPGPGISFTALTASAGGFTAAAQFRSAGGTIGAAIWTSADGKNWTQSQVTGLTGSGSHNLTALVASGAAVTGIDSVQTQASQQFVVRRLPAG